MAFESGEHLVDDVIGPRLTQRCAFRLHECLGGQVIGIDQTGEEIAKHESHSIIACFESCQRRQWKLFVEWNFCPIGM